jgi:hypothetical protein
VSGSGNPLIRSAPSRGEVLQASPAGVVTGVGLFWNLSMIATALRAWKSISHVRQASFCAAASLV